MYKQLDLTNKIIHDISSVSFQLHLDGLWTILGKSSSGHFGDGGVCYENAIFKDNLLLRHRDSSERGGRHINSLFFSTETIPLELFLLFFQGKAQMVIHMHRCAFSLLYTKEG